MLDKLAECNDLVSVSLFDKLRGHFDLQKFTHLKSLAELVLYPIVCTDLFIVSLRDITLKKLISINLGLLMITEEEFGALLDAIGESCPNLKTLKLDLHSLRTGTR